MATRIVTSAYRPKRSPRRRAQPAAITAPVIVKATTAPKARRVGGLGRRRPRDIAQDQGVV